MDTNLKFASEEQRKFFEEEPPEEELYTGGQPSVGNCVIVNIQVPEGY